MSKYVILDLEMCNVPKTVSYKVFACRKEIIQIGAVIVDENSEIADQFMTFVKPQFGVIDDCIEELTGISKKHISTAPDIQSALISFINWIPDDATVVSWSDTDRKQSSKKQGQNRSLSKG